MRLSKLRRALDGATLVHYADRTVRGLSLDSRKVRRGFLFAVVPGPRHDGSCYVPDAVANGAVAILSSARLFVPPDVTLIVVDNVRQALADLCCCFHGHPADRVRTIGVTGTNGKTTVATLVRQVLAAAGKQAALLSTVVHQIGSRRIPAANTTPESPELQAHLAAIAERQIGYAVMEVSSQALDQDRVRGIGFDVAALTNLAAHEHLDYHGTFAAYRAAKARLFESLAPNATAALNRDDTHFEFFRARSYPTPVLTYGLGPGADVSATIESATLEGTTLRLATPVGREEVRSPLFGTYNVMNVLGGATCGLALGLELSTIAKGIERFHGAPGRLECVSNGQPYTVLVDYAHNAAGLTSVLTTLRPLTAGRLIVVFGAGGDRDPSKRPLMGRAAARLADVAIVTADNSRSERTEDIIQAILDGMSADAARVVEPDRREAIRKAVWMARPGDLVVIAGKGHEHYQELDGVRYPFDDRDEARRAVRARSEGLASA